MKSRFMLFAWLSLAATAQAETYMIDGRHTFPSFEVDHYGFTTQRGRFTRTSGKLELDAEHRQGSVDVTIDAASIDMGAEEWNKHMRGERFFNVERFPALLFTARNFRLEPGKPARIEGELTLLGVTRPLTLTVTRFKCAKHPLLPRELCGANLETSVRRSEFGMTYGVPGIGDEVHIVIPIEAIKDVAETGNAETAK